MLFSLSFLSFMLIQLASAAVLTPRSVLEPTADPFYTPPSDLSTSKPGTILRSRQIPSLGLSSLIPIQLKATYQLLYRTTDSLGNASAAVTTIIIPSNANSSRLMSYQTAEDAAYLNCAPSYTLQTGANPADGGSLAAEEILIIAALDQGWIVNVPDYEGLNSVYSSGIQAGQATLDSVRAALASSHLTGISPQASYQMWGYSGGSIASEWAAELQQSYAPELKFAGVAIGGLIPNVSNVLSTINKSLFTGLAVTGINGLASGYPELQQYVNQELIQSSASEFKKPLSQCLSANELEYTFQDVSSYFKNGEAAFSDPIVVQVLNETGIMGQHGTPNMPIFSYKAVGDEISPVADSDALVKKLCAQGATITYNRDGVGEHITEAITAAGDALLFLKARFEGIPISGCTTNNVVTSLTDPGALAALGTVIVNALEAILQLPIGPSSITG